jgi:hypothetical protein
MEYVLVMKCSDTGYIHVEPLVSRSSREMVNAFEKGEAFFRTFGCIHRRVRLDNETSAVLKESFRSLSIEAEYVAPDNHRQNAAESDGKRPAVCCNESTSEADLPQERYETDVLLGCVIPNREKCQIEERGEMTCSTVRFCVAAAS